MQIQALVRWVVRHRRAAAARAVAAAVAAAASLAAGWSCGDPASPASQARREPVGEAGAPGRFNVKDIMPAGRGRDLVLANCQSCHVLVPIFILPLDEAAWYRNSLEHRERVEGLSDGDFEELYRYLAANFTPDRPVPELPPALADAWTTY